MSKPAQPTHQVVAITYNKETNWGQFSPAEVMFEGTREECEDQLGAIEEYVNGAGGYPHGTEVEIVKKAAAERDGQP